MDHFKKLNLMAHTFDEEVAKLNSVWKIPSVLIGGYGECDSEVNAYTDDLWNSIRSTQDSIENTLQEMETPLYDTEQLLEEARSDYEELKSQCDDLESVFMEYGYHHYDNDKVEEKKEDTHAVSTNSVSDQTESLEVEFTPHMSWKWKGKLSGISTPISDLSQTVTTPLVTRLASIVQINSPENYGICTPKRSRPQEPVYSKHFYHVLKK